MSLHSFNRFCNICFLKQNIIKLCEDKHEHILNILITFTSCSDIVNGNIYLCKNCCNKLEEYEKFRELFLTNFVRFRYLYNEHKKKLEKRKDPDIKKKLQSFVDVNVERTSGTPLIENYECMKDVSQASGNIENFTKTFRNNTITCRESDVDIFGTQKNCLIDDNTLFNLESNSSENETHNRNVNYENDSFNGDQKNIPDSITIDKCEPTFSDEDCKDFTSTDNVGASIPYSSPTYDESSNLKTEEKYFETADIKIEKAEPSFCDEDYKDFTSTDNVSASISYSSPTNDESCNLTNEENYFETADIKIEKDEPNSDEFEKQHDKHMSDTVSSVTSWSKSEDDDNSENRVTEDTTVGEGPSDEANKATEYVDICEVCHKGFRSKNYLEIHMRVHTGERPYVCYVCTQKFTTLSGLIIHHRTHTGEKRYSCNVCQKRFTHISSLKRHKHIHSEKPYKCEDCGLRFRVVRNLKIHKYKHTGERPYSCDECKKTFTHVATFYVHKCNDTGEKPFKCDDCGLEFIKSWNLEKHKCRHTDDKPFKCDECDMRFTRNCYLNKHKLTHTGEKRYSCDECHKRFAVKNSLTKHKRLHSGEKPHTCDECGLRFRELHRLNVHKRRHTGERPFSCDECQKKFMDKPCLMRHKLLHSADKPYKCDECGLGFTQRFTLNIHTRRHTGERPFECDVCEKTFRCKSHLTKHKLIHTSTNS